MRFASIPTHFTQFVLHRPPISHANVSNYIIYSYDLSLGMRRISFVTFFKSLHHWSGHATLLSRNYHATEAHSYNQGHRHTHWHTRSLWIVEAAALGHACAPCTTTGKLPLLSPARGQPRPYRSNLISHVGQNFSHSWFKPGKKFDCFTLYFCQRESKCPLRCDRHCQEGPPPGVPSEFGSAFQVRKF